MTTAGRAIIKNDDRRVGERRIWRMTGSRLRCSQAVVCGPEAVVLTTASRWRASGGYRWATATTAAVDFYRKNHKIVTEKLDCERDGRSPKLKCRRIWLTPTANVADVCYVRCGRGERLPRPPRTLADIDGDHRSINFASKATNF